jgi:cell division protease FtsH
VDEEVRRLIDRAYHDALELLHAHGEELGAIANALLSREQLDREDLDELLQRLTPRRAPEQAVAQLATARERRRHAA